LDDGCPALVMKSTSDVFLQHNVSFTVSSPRKAKLWEPFPFRLFSTHQGTSEKN